MESQTPELPPPSEAWEFSPTAKVYPAYEVRTAIAAAVQKERADAERWQPCNCPCCSAGIPAPHEYHLERRPMPAASSDLIDARRYRWLRDYHIGDDPEAINLAKAKKRGLDAAIDAAIRARADTKDTQ